MKKIVVLAVLFLSVSIAFAQGSVPVLVIDSGTDFSHEMLKDIASPNQAEKSGETGKDDDKNGYIDDIFGWNFAGNNAQLVNLEFTPERYDEVMRFMELMGQYQIHGQQGMSAEDFNFLVTNYKDKKFMAWIQFTGGWAHGTHVGGIIATDNDKINMKAVAHIPVGNPPAAEVRKMLQNSRFYFASIRKREVFESREDKKPTMEEIIQYFDHLGSQNALKIKPEAAYVGTLKPRVINCSFGTENKMLLANFKKVMVEQWGFEAPTDEEVQRIVNMFVDKAFLPRDKVLFSKTPNALICIAAGNSTEDPDIMTTSPNDVKIPNKIVVAATEMNKKLAPFSCWGKTKVDIAVPGVGIYSSYPNGKMGYMSGTSQAAPYVAKWASLVLKQNPSLTAVQVKKILVGTVDKKDWLTDKVISGGILNPERALAVAALMKNGKTLTEALKKAKEAVDDMPQTRDLRKPPMTPFELELYNSFAF